MINGIGALKRLHEVVEAANVADDLFAVELIEIVAVTVQ